MSKDSTRVADKSVLIVDDEEDLLLVLKETLERLSAGYHVVAAKDGFSALKSLEEQTFDLVITDYKMAGMDGLELLASVRYKQPNAKVILMTGYISDALQAEAQRFEMFDYLTKPLNLKMFGQVVQRALTDKAIGHAGILALSPERYEHVTELMEKLRMNTKARCVFLSDAEGRPLAHVGDVEKLPVEEIASLLGGGTATLLEVGRALDGESDAVSLIYREGKFVYLYATNVGQHLLLILLIDRTPYSSRLGSVWYYAQQTAAELQQVVGQSEYVDPQQILGCFSEDNLGQQLDELFSGK